MKKIKFDLKIEQLAKKKQKAVIETSSSLTCLVAGPGTGKSKVIEQRVLYLLNKKVSATDIFVVSYTRASANDLKNRIYNYCQEKGCNKFNNIGVSTLHSLALKILKKSGSLSCFPADPRVLDNWEIENIFDLEFSESNRYNKRNASKIRKYHESIWSTVHTDDPFPIYHDVTEKQKRIFDEFHRHRTHLYAAVLPGEIIRLCVEQVENKTSDMIKSYLNVSYLIIDEFQDLNQMDLKLIDIIIKSGISVFVAGDDDQSIYSFRYASPIGIQTFTKKYPLAKGYILSHCFRCPPVILNSAVCLVKNYGGENRIEKEYVSMYEKSDPKISGLRKLWKFRGYKKEAEAIAKSCKNLKDAGLSYSSILILLSNTQLQLGTIKKAFDNLQIQYESPKEKDFQDTKIGRSLLSWLRVVIANEDRKKDKRKDDYIALRSIIGNKKGIGKTTLNSISETVISNRLNFRNIFEKSTSDHLFRTREIKFILAVRKDLQKIDTWKITNTIKNKKDEIKCLLSEDFKQSEFKELDDFLNKLPQEATLQELKDYMEAKNFNNKQTLLKNIHERLGNPESINEYQEKESIKIMTLHGCKGLSGDIVFIPGLEKGLLPNDKQIDDNNLKLEGARILFVGITRAKRCCILSYSTKRSVHGSTKAQEASEYISHLKDQFENGHALSKADCEEIIQYIS